MGILDIKRRFGRPKLKNVERIPSGQIKRHDWQPKLDGSCAVYIMEARNGFIKIGSSVNPPQRLGDLQSETGMELFISWAGRGEKDAARKVERAVHKELKGIKQHQKGEWYRMGSDEAVKHIERVASAMGVQLVTGEPFQRSDIKHFNIHKAVAPGRIYWGQL